MRPIALALVSLTLAACAPAVYVTPGAGDVLPVQAQRIIDAATATAGAQATQDARATQIDLSGRQTATAARQSTLDALQGRQTEVALSLTQGAGLAAATDTQAARTQAAQATAQWATPTARALVAQATAQAADSARRAAQAESAAEFWASLRFIVLALLIVAGLSAICVAVVDGITRIRVARLASRAAIAREAFRLLPPGHWAEWAPGEGYQVYALPGLLDAPAAIIENAPTAPDKAHGWRQSVRLFCWWGDRYGFGVRELGPAGAGVVTDPAWRTLARLLKSAGVLAETTIPGKKGRATAWAPDWNYRRLHDELGHGRLTLPFPADDPAPEVRFTVPNTTPQDGQHNTTPQNRSIAP
jgi:hypothetical protein